MSKPKSHIDVKKLPTRQKGSLIDVTQPVFICSTPMIRDGKQAGARSRQNEMEPIPEKKLVGLENLEMSIISGPWPASPIKFFSKSRTLTLKCKQHKAPKDFNEKNNENNDEQQCPLSPKSKGAVVSSVQLVSSTPMQMISVQPDTTKRKSLRLHNLSLSMIDAPKENKQNVLSSKQFISSTPMHTFIPAKRKSLHNLSVSMIAEPKKNKSSKTVKKSVSNKMQKRREMFKMKMIGKNSISLATTSTNTSKPPCVPSFTKKMVLEIPKLNMENNGPGPCPPLTSDNQHFAKPESVISAHGKQNRDIRNTKEGFTKKTCPPSHNNKDVQVLSKPKIVILSIKKMTVEELSALSKTVLSKEEYLAVKRRRQYLKVFNSMRGSSLPPPSSSQQQAQSIRSLSPQPQCNKEFVVSTNLTRQSLDSVHQKSPSKFATKVNCSLYFIFIFLIVSYV